MKSSSFIQRLRSLTVFSSIMTDTVVFSIDSVGIHDWLENQGCYPSKYDIGKDNIIYIYKVTVDLFVRLIKSFDDYGTSKR